MKKEQLLAEVEDIIRTMPSRADFEERDVDDVDDAVGPWLGRAAAVIQKWDVAYFSTCGRSSTLLERKCSS